MKDLTQSFNRVLEEYLLKIGNEWIDLFTPEQQTELINLINSQGNDMAPLETAASLTSVQPLETEWQQVLNKPVDLRSVDRQWLVGVTRQRISCQKDYLSHLEAAINSTQQQGQRIKATFHREPMRTNLLGRNEAILKLYQRLFDRAHISQLETINLLRRFTYAAKPEQLEVI